MIDIRAWEAGTDLIRSGAWRRSDGKDAREKIVRVITQLPNYDLYESQKVARLAESVGFDGVRAF